MALGDLLIHLMVNYTFFLLVVQVELYLTVGVRGVKVFAERGWKWGEKMFGGDILEWG